MPEPFLALFFGAARFVGGNVKKASVIGLGSIAHGDLGGGCYLIDALLQEPLGEAVEVSYLAEASFYAGAIMCGAEFGIIVQAVSMGGPPGKIWCWDKITFEQNFNWLCDQCWTMSYLVDGFARAGLSGIFPDDLMFLWIEPKVADGIGISPEMSKALRKTIKMIKGSLFRKGFLPESAFRLSSIHHLEVLGATV